MNIYFYAVIITFFLYFIIKIVGRKSNESEAVSTQSTAGGTTPQSNDIRSFLIFSSIFWIIGLTMVVGGYRKLMDYKEIQRTYSQTTAQITDVREYEVLDNEGNRCDERDVSLSYTVDGQTYETVIKKANIYHSAGYEIDIYYSPENPEVIVSPDHVESRLSFILPTGVILCIIPFVLEIAGRILLKKQKRST